MRGTMVVLMVNHCECPMRPTGAPELAGKKPRELTDEQRRERTGKPRGWCTKLYYTCITDEMAARPFWAKALAKLEGESVMAAAWQEQLRRDVLAGASSSDVLVRVASTRDWTVCVVHMLIALLCAVHMCCHLEHKLSLLERSQDSRRLRLTCRERGRAPAPRADPRARCRRGSGTGRPGGCTRRDGSRAAGSCGGTGAAVIPE